MKKCVMIISILMMIFLVATPKYTYALNLTDVSNGGEYFIDQPKGKEMFDVNEQKSAIDSLYWIMMGIAIAAALIIGMILAMQFITSGVSGKAKIKEKLIPYAVGVVVAVGAFGIWKLAIYLVNEVF